MHKSVTTLLSRRELEALEYASKYKEAWGKKASFQKLARRGFVKRKAGSDVHPSWAITAQGLHHLKGFPHMIKQTETTPSSLAKETTEAIFDYDDQIPASQNSMAYDYACIIQRALDKAFSEGFQKGQTYDK